MDWKELDIAYRASDIDKLMKLCDKILAKDFKNLHARYYRALALRKKGNLEQSISVLDEMVLENPNEADFWAERAVSYLNLNMAEKALEDFNMALSLDANNPYRYSSRAFAKAHFKDVDGAIEDYQQALELDPDDATVLNNLGLLQEQKGKKSSAQNLYAKADKIAGVKHTDPKDIVIEEEKQQRELPQEKPKLTVALYFKTAREMLFTKQGRKEFFGFFRNKLKKKH